MVSWDPHVRRGHPIMMVLIIIFGIIELSISAWLTSRYNAHHNYLNTSERDRTRFLLFTSIWTIVFSTLYSLLFFQSPDGSFLTSVGSHAIFMFLTWVFWLSGAAAITASLGGGLNCGRDHVTYCGQLNALEAFAWVEFVLTTFALVVIMLRGIAATRRGDGIKGALVS
ncbi:MARVEL domain-containing protein [Phanerochaete sordida]|uniref:MARVEL domain-containing protein n=1 Tax=Phanerochaete sordida TaxID=48140 RepID=A0A9P3G5K5_9APHY|nr:MARVEL domain-containing protein [Phanerochaete sordida]